MQTPLPHLLIGERDPFMQRTLERILKGRFALAFAEDGAELLARARRNPPDLVILEALLPALDGFQLCRQLKSDLVTRAVPVLFYTVLAAEARALQAGADGFLKKPQPPGRLIAEIRRLLAASLQEEEK
jgi:putative two-component system response regulator